MSSSHSRKCHKRHRWEDEFGPEFYSLFHKDYSNDVDSSKSRKVAAVNYEGGTTFNQTTAKDSTTTADATKQGIELVLKSFTSNLNIVLYCTFM